MRMLKLVPSQKLSLSVKYYQHLTHEWHMVCVSQYNKESLISFRFISILDIRKTQIFTHINQNVILIDK